MRVSIDGFGRGVRESTDAARVQSEKGGEFSYGLNPGHFGRNADTTGRNTVSRTQSRTKRSDSRLLSGKRGWGISSRVCVPDETGFDLE